MLKELLNNDIIKRAVKTFIQAFLGSLAVTLPTTDLTNTALIKSTFIGALAMGLSAIMNLIINALKKEGK